MAMIATIKTYDKRHTVWGIFFYRDLLGTRLLIPQIPNYTTGGLVADVAAAISDAFVKRNACELAPLPTQALAVCRPHELLSWPCNRKDARPRWGSRLTLDHRA